MARGIARQQALHSADHGHFTTAMATDYNATPRGTQSLIDGQRTVAVAGTRQTQRGSRGTGLQGAVVPLCIALRTRLLGIVRACCQAMPSFVAIISAGRGWLDDTRYRRRFWHVPENRCHAIAMRVLQPYSGRSRIDSRSDVADIAQGYLYRRNHEHTCQLLPAA